MEYKYRQTPISRRPLNTKIIMYRLLAGLLVVYAFGLFKAYQWGSAYFINTILLLVVSLVVGTLTEVVFALACKKNVIEHLTSSFHYITCVILVLIVPCNTSLYVIGVGTFISLFFGKLVFGGFGQNVFNPAGVGKAVMSTSFSGKIVIDAISSPTVTTAFANMNWISDKTNYLALINSYGGMKSILFGDYFGAIGETCTLLILLVGIALALLDVIDWRIPAVYIGTMFVGSLIVGLTHGLGISYALAFISTGGIAFGGVFMLTDPVTNPQTRPGKMLFAAIAALLTVLIRFLGNLPEGVVFSILIVNMLSPTIDELFGYKQIIAYKRNSIIVIVSIVVTILVTAIVGSNVTPGVYKSDAVIQNRTYIVNKGGAENE